MLCRLLPAYQINSLLPSTRLVRELTSSIGLPPNDTTRTAADPSGNVELMRTVPFGERKYGALSVPMKLAPKFVVDRKLFQMYLLCFAEN